MTKNTVKINQAFTLIELLVVIAIIALLLSIVLPSLAKVKEMARKTVCAAHMRDIGQEVAVYAQDNDDGLPPRKVKDNSGNSRDDIEYNHWSRYFQVDWPGRTDNGYWNLGVLWESGQITDSGEVFYCPSKHTKFPYKDYASPSFPTPRWASAGGYIVNTSYSFNPECESISNRNRRYKKIAEGGSHMLLLADVLVSYSITHEKGWNAMSGDGSVSFKIVPEVQQIIDESADANPVGFDQKDYSRFDQVIRLLK